jgi:serine/threonine-protein kinase HipA
MTTLTVYFEQRRVGTIDVDKTGPGFTYDPNWVALRGAFPISLTMPLRSERIAPDTFLPWAANLLPESEQLRTLGQILGMAHSDVIGLLSAIGRDTAGALSIGEPGRTASVQWTASRCVRHRGGGRGSIKNRGSTPCKAIQWSLARAFIARSNPEIC